MKQLVFAVFLLSIAGAVRVSAQTGTIAGTVREAETGEPVVNVVVLLKNLEDSTKQRWVYTDSQGAYVLKEIPTGSYSLQYLSVAHHSHVADNVSVGESPLRMDITLVPKIILLDGVVISASRREQKLLDAPASISVVDVRAIVETPTITPTDHLRAVAGVDVAQTGLLQQNVVVRGFNNVFSGTLMMLTDNRLAGVPSLRLNAPYLIACSDDDFERVEIVRGPGSALYGPNAANGVVNFITASPFSSQGTSVSTTVGERSIFQGSFRHANALSDRFAYKFSGLYFRGRDWRYTDPAEQSARADAIAAGANPATLKIGKRESDVERYAGEARFDFLPDQNISAVATVGITRLVRGVELTDIGAAQGRNWDYTYAQIRLSYDDLFLQAFLNKSDAGDSYLLRSGEPVVDRSSQFVAQVQHSMTIGDVQRFVYGADLLFTRPETEGTINGQNENSDDIDEYGGYLQSETSFLGKSLDLVFAARIDKHNRLKDPVFSPRAGVIFRAAERHDIRLTYNRAYSTPTSTELFLDIESVSNVFGFPDPYTTDVRAIGVPTSGLNFERSGGVPVMYSPFSPGLGLPVNSAVLLWPAVVNIMAANGVDISGIPAPGPQDVGGLMAMLNPETGSFDPVSDVYNINQLKPTVTQTIELGYKGVLSNRLQMSVDVYTSRITNFIGPLEIFTPNVFLNGGDVKAYVKPYIKQALMNGGMTEPEAEAASEAQSTQIGGAVGQIPLGTVTPREAADRTAILLGSRNFGTVNLQGIDFWVDYRFSGRVSAEASYSYVTKNFFEKLDGITDISLNAPKTKGSLAMTYRNPEIGFFSKVRYRWTGGFRMTSGVYVGNVNAKSFVDVNAGLESLGISGLGVSVSVTNLLGKRHRYFIGAPEIGRMLVGKLSYTF
jgi:outer membrane receptor for ferrienterochelin and colicins